ncbi:MAG: helix-hairpin-helix domain-containing protein [PVC group bacterium]|nr:helix-hairpin-helix domain-containing protein [PVC group bacterium]
MQDFSLGERKVIVFILAVLILGLGLSWMRKNMPQAAPLLLSVEPSSEQETISQKQEMISINSADAEMLCQLSGIGPVIAQRIVAYREKNGQFKTKQDLINVKGIGPKKFQRIKDRIVCGNSVRE